MRRLPNLLVSLVVSECGGDVIEYALLTALVAIIAVNAFSLFATRHLLKFYNTIATDLGKDFKK
jgi:Flp pilus assembly pilin Flp